MQAMQAMQSIITLNPSDKQQDQHRNRIQIHSSMPSLNNSQSRVPSPAGVEVHSSMPMSGLPLHRSISDAPDIQTPSTVASSSRTESKKHNQQSSGQAHPDKRYKCSFCARAFSRSEHKNRHERSHTKERPFKCDRCKSTFVRRDLLLRHVRTVHAKVVASKSASTLSIDQTSEPDRPPQPILPPPRLMPQTLPAVFPTVQMQMPTVNERDRANNRPPTYATTQNTFGSDDRTYQHANSEISAAVLMTRLGAIGTTWDERDERSHDGSEYEDDSGSRGSRSYESPHSPPSLKNLLEETLLSLDQSGSLLRDTALPTDRELTYYLMTYMTAHHPFHPFIHLPTFSPQNTPRPLLLAILSLGALPSNKELASRLHVSSKMMVNSRIDTDGFSSRSAPLWVTQTVLLNTAFAAWSGDPRGLEFACSVKSFLANMVSGVRFEIFQRSPKPPITNSVSEDDEWIKSEAMRRTYFAVFVFFGELTAFFNFPPTIPNSEPEVIMLPCDEDLWNGTRSISQSSDVIFRTGMEYVLKGQHVRCSSFAKRVLATGMFIECWASRSGGLLFAARTDQLDGVLSSFSRVIHADIVGCLNRASEATWKLARMRVVAIDLTTIEEALRYHDVSEIVHAVRTCASRMTQSRESLMIAAELAFDVLFGPQQEDAVGGIEDVIVEWECALYLMMWVRRVEHDMAVVSGEAGLFIHAADERELDVLQRLRSVQERKLQSDLSEEMIHGENRLSVFIGWWWSRHGAKDVAGGWGIRSVLREAIGLYSEVVRRELVN
ncbi:hypothetical protein V1512DRAFT_265176 [Lipomyces arxii]|uniref:uncharacterized protein n=1 Tax=Lipomyces arxii TaxID=56418 RepID=UPI0034CDE390